MTPTEILKMAKIFITPVLGTARTIRGRVCVGGTQYVVANELSVEVRNLLALNLITKLDGVTLNDDVPDSEYYELLRELERDKPRDVEKETTEDYFANLVRFAAESLNSKKVEDEEKPVVEKKQPKPKTEKETTETAAKE